MGLMGRETETATLQNVLNRLTTNKKSNELILLSGQSGSGKSTLAKTLEQEVARTGQGIFAEGKIDLNSNEEPYSGIASAFGQLFRTIQDGNPSALQNIAETIRRELGSDVNRLSIIIPELENLVGAQDVTEAGSREGGD